LAKKIILVKRLDSLFTTLAACKPAKRTNIAQENTTGACKKKEQTLCKKKEHAASLWSFTFLTASENRA
jgi:hypothetical protein